MQCGAPVDGHRCDHCGAAQRAGEYVVERVIAQSPRGRMYVARGKDGRQVALKELIFVHVPDAQTVVAFEREGRVLGTLSHPRIPRFVGAFQEGRGVHLRLYLAQEFVEGPNAAQRASTARFTEDEALGLGDELLEVLEYLHGLSPRVVHRDVKPANLVLRANGGLTLVDFDAARDLGREATHRSTMVGTTGYMAPEQYGGTVSQASDLYGVGATLLHLLTGQTPPVPQPGQPLAHGLVMNVSHGTRAVLDRLTEWAAERRYASATDARRALAEARAQAQTEGPLSPRHPPRAPALPARRESDLPLGHSQPLAAEPARQRTAGRDGQPVPLSAAGQTAPGSSTVIVNGKVVPVSQLGQFRMDQEPREAPFSPTDQDPGETDFLALTGLVVAAIVALLLLLMR